MCVTLCDTHRSLLSRLWNWDFGVQWILGLKSNGVRSPWDVSIEDVVCVWCTLPYFALPLIGRSVCNTWRTLLSNIKDVIQPYKTAKYSRRRRCPPFALYRLPLSSLTSVSFKMSESFSGLFLFCLLLLIPHVNIVYITSWLLVRVSLLWGQAGIFSSLF